MYVPTQGSYRQFLNVYNEYIAKGMQHEEIAHALNMGLNDYYHLHANAEASELNYGRFIPCPVHLTKRDIAAKERVAAMQKLLKETDNAVECSV